ncbi:hypothetical protein MSG28_000381 [Choristoneura fumiferana]|uniref:Uncharacterized protein n=1 Tax=Choristoneura fumiferana TaxID=7141 RepID=A0ACC0K0J1_CHOFU|nr:hypothetical protein MSG28_000381 [Choristoneura fumiferana]
MALKKVKGNFERMFDKNLTDLVRGIRNNKDNEAKYIAQCMEEIKVELRQDNIAVKANAVAKLTYGFHPGYQGFFCATNVMLTSHTSAKEIIAKLVMRRFHPELLMLTTNMIRKDLNAQNQYEAGLALSGLSCFISHDLARDLANDIMTLMSSTKPYLRMKAVLMMYKVFLRYPEALRPAFPKLKEKLEDPDPVLVDITIPHDENLVKAEKDKLSKYLDLADQVTAMWDVDSTIIVPIVVSANGLIAKSLDQHLKRLSLYGWIKGQIQKAVLLDTARIVRRFLTLRP